MAKGGEARVHHVVVMRHGDRIDRVDRTWASQATQPWDPVLTDGGKARARAAGVLMSELGFPIHCVFVSPFARCRETAAEVLKSLRSAGFTDGQNAPMRSSVKVSIEYGLGETLSIKPSRFPKDGILFPDLSQLVAIFPEEIVDLSVTPIYQQMPEYGEPVNHVRRRLESVILSLADQYPRENLLLITHGEAVWVSVQCFYRHVEILVDYCGFSHLERKISFNSPEEFTAESFNLLTGNNDTGLIYT